VGIFLLNAHPSATEAANRQLSDKEYKITTLLVDGYEYEKIANFMDLSVDGVRYYIKSIYKKLQVNSRKELAKKFVRDQD
jgi:DNA-binding CsgD family transcriptional regulator